MRRNESNTHRFPLVFFQPLPNLIDQLHPFDGFPVDQNLVDVLPHFGEVPVVERRRPRLVEVVVEVGDHVEVVAQEEVVEEDLVVAPQGDEVAERNGLWAGLREAQGLLSDLLRLVMVSMDWNWFKWRRKKPRWSSFLQSPLVRSRP